jgi:hypothetical protein
MLTILSVLIASLKRIGLVDKLLLFIKSLCPSKQSLYNLYKFCNNFALIKKQKQTMNTLILMTEFFGGIVLFFAIGCLIGHLLKLDKYFDKNQNDTKLTHS